MKRQSGDVTFIRVKFPEHFTPARVTNMLANLGYHGDLAQLSPTEFLIRVTRPANLAGLRKSLTIKERYGFLSWTTEDSNFAAGEEFERLRAAAPEPLPDRKAVPKAGPPVLIPAIRQVKKKHLNVSQRRALKATDARLFLQQYGRKAQKGQDPNDRGYSRDVERKLKSMKPEELDRLLRDGED